MNYDNTSRILRITSFTEYFLIDYDEISNQPYEYRITLIIVIGLVSLKLLDPI